MVLRTAVPAFCTVQKKIPRHSTYRKQDISSKEMEQATLFLMAKLYAQRNDTTNALATFNQLIDERQRQQEIKE